MEKKQQAAGRGMNFLADRLLLFPSGFWVLGSESWLAFLPYPFLRSNSFMNPISASTPSTGIGL